MIFFGLNGDEGMNQLLAMRAYVRVVEASSFIRASDQLGLPRSTVSKLITDLEKHLGIKLIHRTTRSVAVTPEGLEYYHQAVRLVSGVDAADNAVRSKKNKPRGNLRIDAPVSLAHSLLIPALPEFHEEYPDVTVSLGVSDKTVSIVGDGVDCAIRGGKLQDMSMIARKIFELDYVTCASPSYLEKYGTPASPDDLKKGHKIVGYFFASTGRMEPLIFTKGDKSVEIHESHFSVNEGDGLAQMMVAGLGIGQHLRRFMQQDIDAGRLVPLLTDWGHPKLPFHVIYPPNPHQSARLRAFINWLSAKFRLT
jgi:DNA-binding transcriptional LysR family regulator